jgi:hypothetical protein
MWWSRFRPTTQRGSRGRSPLPGQQQHVEVACLGPERLLRRRRRAAARMRVGIMFVCRAANRSSSAVAIALAGADPGLSIDDGTIGWWKSETRERGAPKAAVHPRSAMPGCTGNGVRRPSWLGAKIRRALGDDLA